MNEKQSHQNPIRTERKIYPVSCTLTYIFVCVSPIHIYPYAIEQLSLHFTAIHTEQYKYEITQTANDRWRIATNPRQTQKKNVFDKLGSHKTVHRIHVNRVFHSVSFSLSLFSTACRVQKLISKQQRQ